MLDAPSTTPALRFAFDMGTNSIGWCAFSLSNGSPETIIDAGVRLFGDGRNPKDNQPLAVGCRVARGMRKRRDRIIHRKKLLLQKLIALGLLPHNEEERQKLKDANPYALRDKALSEPVSPHELGRILIHMAQRRGFKSNRRADNKEEKKKSALDLDALENTLRSTNMLLGQYLWKRLQEGQGTRARAGAGLYPLRAHYEAEFKEIRAIQAPHLPQVSEEDWKELHEDILFFQRPLQKQEVGYCQVYYEDGLRRAPLALASFQRFRIAQNLVNLRIVAKDRKSNRPLTPAEQKMLAEAMEKQKAMDFKKIRKLLKIEEGESFNLESDKREKLEGNETSATLMKKEYFGARWNEFSLIEQDSIIETLLTEESRDGVRKMAVDEWNLSQEQADAIADDLSPDDLPQGYARYCVKALREILEIITQQGLTVTEAIQELRQGRSKKQEEWKSLPYYGEIVPESMVPSPKRGDEDTRRFGKINNPTVHIALNQLRRVVNELIKVYGKPKEIHLEMARSLKLTEKAKKELDKFQSANKKINDEAIEKFAGKFPATDENLKRYKLWRELAEDPDDRCCPYSGRKISVENLMSNAIEIEHILPESITFDGSMKNLTVAFKEANRSKGNRSPDQAFDTPSSPYPYEEIVERVKRSKMANGKKRKFYPGALQAFFKTEDGFISRQLNDTQYLCKIAKKYLEAITDRVHVIPGQLTARLRHEWGLNSILAAKAENEDERAEKNRNDHRHHAVDAVVIGCTDHAMLMKASKASGKDGYNWKVEFDTPWEKEQFRRDVDAAIQKITVSHKPDHGTQGQLHEETYYGIISEGRMNAYEQENGYNVVTRSDFRTLFTKMDPTAAEKATAKIRDAKIREEVRAVIAKATNAKEVETLIDAYAKEKGMRRIRILKKEGTIIPICHTGSDGKQYEKGIVPGSNHHIAFWKMPDDTIEAKGVSYFDINAVGTNLNKLKPHPAAKLICKFHNGDLIAVEKEGKRFIYKVVSLKPANKIIMCVEQKEAGNISKRVQEKDITPLYLSFGKMAFYKVRKVYNTPAGKLHDPGSMF